MIMSSLGTGGSGAAARSAHPFCGSVGISCSRRLPQLCEVVAYRDGEIPSLPKVGMYLDEARSA